jgi:hypothetical protein
MATKKASDSSTAKAEPKGGLVSDPPEPQGDDALKTGSDQSDGSTKLDREIDLDTSGPDTPDTRAFGPADSQVAHEPPVVGPGGAPLAVLEDAASPEKEDKPYRGVTFPDLGHSLETQVVDIDGDKVNKVTTSRRERVNMSVEGQQAKADDEARLQEAQDAKNAKAAEAE